MRGLNGPSGWVGGLESSTCHSPSPSPPCSLPLCPASVAGRLVRGGGSGVARQLTRSDSTNSKEVREKCGGCEEWGGVRENVKE